ncbi:alpha-2-macroglobulin-like protein 1 [Cyrtonyx montezumae]|uniref:alpha-2-macroglobulin-like protein 1 n=1 Tax=Cyrtonyx montezumae TaxID=9017 RepID=UPI0032DAE3B2
MGAPVLLLALALFLVADEASLELQYMVVFPAVIHQSQEEKLCIHLSSLTEAVHLAVTLEVEIQNQTLVEQDVEKPGNFECISFKVPKLNSLETDASAAQSEEVAFLHVLIHSSDSVLFEGRKKVLVKPQKNIILVETDKAFYKPGETVKFRIINLDDDLMVIKNECLQIWLQDPEYNRIAEWMNVKSRHGILDLSFPLASEAVLGEYTIFVQQDMAQKKFSVKEYELTKIELKIEHPPFISTEDKEFQLKLCGKYTYGKPAQGKIDITFITLLQFEMNDFSNSSEMRKQQSWTDKNGCANFTVKTKALELNEYESSIIVIGEMEEAGTGAKTKDLSEISIVTRIKSIEFVNLHPFYKRGLPYTGQMFCHSDDSPLQNEMVYLTVDVDDEKTHLSFLTDEEGKVHFSLNTTNWNTSLVSLKGTYYLRNDTNNNYGQNAGIGESFHWLKPFYSESNSFLEIKARNDVMPCDQEQDVQVDYILDQNKLSSEIDHIDFYYMIIAKGRILFSGEKQVSVLQHENLHGSFSLTLTIGNDFLPDIKLLVYTLFLDGEVVADVEEFQVAKCFRHKVELDFSSKQEVPGSKVSLNLKAAPGSFCSVQSVDKRVLLMKNNILTADTLYMKVFDDSFTIGGRGFPYHLEDFDAYPCLPQQSSLLKKAQMGAPWYQSDADVFNLFKLLRMKILTNTKIKKPVSCMQQNFERKMLTNKDSVVGSHVVPANLAPQSDDTKKPKPRTHFPETWIWDLVPVSHDGQASLQVTVPDTITEWNANTFCVANTGFGLSHLTTLRVFQPFFVDLSLPYSVTQGEIFSLKATVFNYLKDCIQVHTTLIETPELKVDACPGCQFTSCLCANEVKTFAWNVTATRLGKVNVTVSSVAEESHNLCDNRVAVTPLQGKTDTVIKPLLVKPGGILQEKTQNAFLCAADNTVLEEFSLILPAETLEGSGRATFSVIGDIMGPALQNLDQLLEMPFGCGEQNMVQFAPNIFILQYLKKTKQLDPEIEATALYFLKTGYQRQLLYKHDDGSYSAFGKSDTQGNTWLTAFVARSFGQASSYIYINKDHVQDAVLWLQKHQLSNGCFQSVGKLFNNDLKGGVNDTLSLTAYIAAALLELQLEKNDTMLDKALYCLKNVTFDEASLYVKALMAYVFSLTEDMEMRQELLDKLEKETAEHLTSDSSSERSSSMIEIVAYILLAHVSKPDFAVSESAVSKLVHWLSKQRNALGGFASTQDTVVSLQALAQYAALIPHEIRDVKVTVKGKEASPLEFHVHKNNKLVLHQASLLEIPGMYKVEATGRGCVYIQSTLYYNTLPPKTEVVFLLDVETVTRECDGIRKQFDIHVSVSYTGDRVTSNMALLEVDMLSGFIPIKKSVKELENVLLVKKTEIKPDKVTVYLEELNKTSLKLIISVEQDNEVQNLKPATVHVYDYYKPDDRAAREYNSPCNSDV